MGAAAAPDTRLVHGTCLLVGGWGILLLGPPGSGKSDLALRLIDRPGQGTGTAAMTARLVADDQVVITRHGDRLVGAPPPRLAGLMEVRGLGIVTVDHVPQAEVGLAVRLTDAAGIERLPEKGEAKLMLLGLAVPEIAIDAAAASAAARIRAAIAEIARQPSPA